MDEQHLTVGSDSDDGRLIASLRGAVDAELVEAVVLGVDIQAHPAAQIHVLGDDLFSDELVLDIRTEPARIEVRPADQSRPEVGGASDQASSLLLLVNRARYRVDGIGAVSSEPAGLGELAELTYRSGRLDRPGVLRHVLSMGQH